ncbi:MAG TPA: hypothetical protein VFR68_14190 [Candidatus Dormibacteraeota bacterium]|nr:hypothetical protein [Candidatus Dormibacteraeota bacterium]
MVKTDRREILSRVAAGTISPEEAAAQLDSINATETEAETAIRKVRVVRQLGVVEIVGDPNVRGAVAEGPHEARIEGDVMVFEGPSNGDEPGSFFFGIGRSLANEKLLVRLNPSLALDLQLQAGSCRVSGVEGPIRADVQAGSATIEGFAKPFDLSVQAGSVKASGCCSEGESRIACDAGSVTLHLERGSGMRVRARAHMGKVALPDAEVTGTHASHEVTIGDGGGSLVINTNMGSVKVTADQ